MIMRVTEDDYEGKGGRKALGRLAAAAAASVSSANARRRVSLCLPFNEHKCDRADGGSDRQNAQLHVQIGRR